MIPRFSAAGVAAALLILAAAPAAPAEAQLEVRSTFGEAADAATGVSSGSTLALGLTSARTPLTISLTAGVPTDADTGTLWGDASLWGDWPRLLEPLGASAAVEGFLYRDRLLGAGGGAVTALIQAYHDLNAGPFLVRLKAAGRGGLLSADSLRVRRALAGGGIDATVAGGPAALRLSAELWSGSEAVYPAVAATTVLQLDRVRITARVQQWLHRELTRTGWWVGTQAEVTDRLSVIAHAASPVTDILFFTPPQRSWGIGIQLFTGSSRREALPEPVVVAPGRTVELRVLASRASGPVRVAGTFNEWQPQPMTRADDQWVLALRLEPGVHEFTFVDADGRWFVPEGTPGRKPDGFGGWVGTVVVR